MVTQVGITLTDEAYEVFKHIKRGWRSRVISGFLEENETEIDRMITEVEKDIAKHNHKRKPR